MRARIRDWLSSRAGRDPRRPDTVWNILTAVVAKNPEPDAERALAALAELQEICKDRDEYLYRALRMLALHRSVVVQKRLMAELGPIVQAGPFAGMCLAESSQEGAYLPKLLGCYEADLHGEWERIIATGRSDILNIGCADGYYAVGLARRMPGVRIHAFDTSAVARASCRHLARRNGVEDRIEIGGTFTGGDFARFADRDMLVICDIEGGEWELLDPTRYPALKDMDLIVEMHGLQAQGGDVRLTERFRNTHRIRRIDAKLHTWPLPSALAEADELDRLLAVWEWRIEPTPWVVLERLTGGTTALSVGKGGRPGGRGQ